MPGKLLAQGCQLEADFTFTLVPNGCGVEFAASYTGPGTATHAWQFYEQATATGPFSTSNLANPLHTFDGLSQVRWVVHTITITQNGQVATFTCARGIDYNCDGCNQSLGRFTYAVNSCTVTFTAINSTAPASWTFGDGNTATGAVVTHTYTANGDYNVQLSQNGFSCYKRIRTYCGTVGCCNANFTANINLDCATLCLNLEAECEMDGQHTWSVTSGGCLAAIKAGKTSNIACIQLTNINTVVTPSVSIAHTFTCSNGQVQTATQVLNIPYQGIFIGERGATRNLSTYECVLPGASYAGNLPVYMSGKITVDKKAFTFSGAEIFVEPGDVGFDVPSGRALGLVSNALGTRTAMRGVPGCNCLWRGNDALTGGNITTNGAILEDAVFALRAWGKSTLSIMLTDFNRDFVGIRATNGAFTLSRFERNVLDGLGTLRDACTLLPKTAEIVWPSGGPVAYSTSKGYVRIYAGNIGTLNLLPIAFIGHRNVFKNLVMGIRVSNTNLRVDRNSRFFNIDATGYAFTSTQDGAAAIRFMDSPVAGSNTCKIVGNGPPPAATIDFDQCAVGVHISSSVQGNGAAGTRVHIANCRMDNMQHGIMMRTGSLSGTLAGGSNASFKGVFSNHITADRFFISQMDQSISGITIFEQSPTVSSLQIYQNTFNGKGPLVDFAPTFGIKLVGNPQNLTSQAQIDVHRNAIKMSGVFWAGVWVENQYGAVCIHDNNTATMAGAGIFLENHIPALNFPVGILFSGGSENVAGCNDVIALNDLQEIGALLMCGNHNDGFIIKNRLFSEADISPFGLATFFFVNGMNTNFRCNTIEGDCASGLYYGQGAQTGHQGQQTPPTTYGNKWIGNFAAGANAFDNPPTNSRYYVRPLTTELPSVGIPNWFFPSVPNTIEPVCLFSCPITAPIFTPQPTVNEQEASIADGTIQYDYYPAVTAWWNEHDLYRKLLRYPALRQGNTLMQNFFGAKSGTSLGKLVNAVSASDSLFSLSNAQQSSIQDLHATMDVLEAQIAVLDSLINQASDSLTWAPLLVQRERKTDTLAIHQAAAQVIFEQIEQQRIFVAPSVLTSIDAVAPSNAFETNLKIVLRIFVRFAALGIEPSVVELSDLSSIGSGCPFVVGPAKYTARTLYAQFTGINLIETPCPPGFADPNSEDRAQRQEGGTSLTLYPNPASDRLEVRYDTPESAGLSIQNGLGQLVLHAALQASGQAIDISALAPGYYLVRLKQEGKSAVVRPLIIHR